MHRGKPTNPIPQDPLQHAREEAFVKVNSLVLDNISAKIKAYPSMDMAGLLEHQLKMYPALRKAFGDSAVKSAVSASSNSTPPSETVAAPADVRHECHIPEDVEIVRPLGAALMRAAQMETSHDRASPELSTVVDRLNILIASSDTIWNLGSTGVFGLNSELVVKIGQNIDISHISTLDYIKHQAPDVPSPDIHGILLQSNSKRIFLFMSRVPGEPLDTKWKYLDETQKVSIREQLESITNKFRHIPAPPAEEADAVLGGGSPRRCKDVRRQICNDRVLS